MALTRPVSTHCRHGHPYDGTKDKDGHNVCRICKRKYRIDIANMRWALKHPDHVPRMQYDLPEHPAVILAMEWDQRVFNFAREHSAEEAAKHFGIEAGTVTAVLHG